MSARPEHDIARLQEIADLALLSPDVDAILEQITADAARALALPISMITVVLDEAQHVAAAHGLEGWVRDAGGVPIEWSLCAHSVRTREPFVVQDATVHPLIQHNPLVLYDGLRCYAGIPLITTRGHVIGNLCVVGAHERPFTDEDLATLRAFARQAISRIESRRTA